jgi:hypothetical protein
MRRFVILAISFSAGLFCVTSSRAQSVPPETDNQSWNDLQVTIPLSKKAEFVIIGTLRLGDNLTQFVDEREGFRVNYQIQKYITLQTLYFHRDAKAPQGRHEREERYTLGANIRVPLGKFNLNTRNWIEHRWRDPQPDAWRYRNRINWITHSRSARRNSPGSLTMSFFTIRFLTIGCAIVFQWAAVTPSTNISPWKCM